MRLIRLPGVHRPLSDTWMLGDCLLEHLDRPGRSVLELCAGTGPLAVTAARAGARATAADHSWRCVLSCWLNARLHGVRVEVRRGDLFAAVAGRRFDFVVANPPYLPAATERLRRHRRGRSVDAGRDGRRFVDSICAQAPDHLRPGGSVLVLHSSVNGVERTLAALGAAGLEAAVASRHHGPLGPVLHERAPMMERRGLLPAGCREEDILVVRGRRPSAARSSPPADRRGATPSA